MKSRGKKKSATHAIVNTRLQKRSKQTNFDIEEFVTTLFGNTPPTHADVRDANIDLARQFCATVVASAKALDVDDHETIYDTLCYLLSNNYSRRAYPDHVYQSKFQTPANLKSTLRHRLKWLIKVTTECDRDKLLANFFAKPHPTVMVKMSAMLLDLSDEKFHLNFTPDWISIYRLMLNHDIMEQHLDQLEQSLQNYCRSHHNNLPTRRDGMFVLPTVPANPQHQFKILSGFMYEWARENDFKQRAKLLGGVEARPFFKMLLTRSIFKDCAVNVGEEHGAWSHAIQWYCVFEHHKQTGFLVHTPMETYQEFGDPSQQRTEHGNMWEKIFDQAFGDDFTSPEHLMRSAEDDVFTVAAGKRPLLSQTLIRNQAKMFEKYGNEMGYRSHLQEKHANDWDARVVYFKL